jgi:DNA processing protein
VLYIEGDVSVLKRPQIAIVGSRNPSKTGVELAERFAAELAGAGFVITSGLALGIDYASHSAALRQGGMTIAVLGSGLSVIYPKRHGDFAKRVAQQGALVSEFPPTTPPRARHFPQRNRIISGLSLGVLVIEAALQSGSLITAHFANEQGREVFAIPGSIHNPLAKGCHLLLRQGAKLVESVHDIYEEFAPALCQALVSQTKLPHSSAALDKERRKLVECLGFEPTSIDKIVERSRLSAERVAVLLLALEMEGWVARGPGGYTQSE